jgi:N-acetylmuramoyl-L-alanine amidase
VALSAFALHAPRRQEPQETRENELASTHTDMENLSLNAVIDTDLNGEPLVVKSSLLSHQYPPWNWDEPVDQRLDDFNLLLSSNGSIRLSALFGLDVKTIVIDPGHGGKDPGAIGENGTQEKDITLDVAIKLKERLVASNAFHVLLTRSTDRTISLAERVDYAKANSADIFISIHVNSLPQKSVNLIETFYFGPPLNIHALRLAEKENQASNFTVGELGSIIQDIGNTLKRQESARLAACIQKRLFINMKDQDDQVVNSGIKMAPFVVLSQIEVPSVLVEISCLSKAEEESKLALTGYREQVASYIEEGIVSYLETQPFQIAKGEN